MDATFRQHVEQLPAQLRQLMESEPLSTLPEAAGIYLMSEGRSHLYVGRTNNVRRHKNHTRPSSGHNKATLAFRIAREVTGRTEAQYSRAGSRQALLADSQFSGAFDAAKTRVRRMHVRFIRVDHPVQQALLEIYAAISLSTPYNDFDNH